MSIIKLNNLNMEYNRKILDNINLDITAGEKIGIVGANGSGKTTLLKIILGIEKPTSGSITLDPKVTVGYLKQATEYTTEDFVSMAGDRINISEFLKLNSEMNLSKNIDFSKARIESLSGGEKTKIALSNILVKNPDILILDEPTNHVDINSVEWLIKRINKYNGTLLVVSHDRYFLNSVANKIIELDNAKATMYHGNYDYYEKAKILETEKLRLQYGEQQKEDKRVQKEIIQLKQWSTKGEKEAGKQGGMRSDSKIKGVKSNAQSKAQKTSRMAKNKIVRLEQSRDKYIEKPRDEANIKFNFSGINNGATALIRAENITKKFKEQSLFDNSTFNINNKEKVGLIGSNGSGKTTLLKIIMGIEELSNGSLWKTPSLKMAYMSQDVFNLDEKRTIMEVASVKDNNYKQSFLSNLVNMGINKNIFNNKISTLSLGERMRIKLVEIILGEYNLLILDEPTNHLDLPNKIELERTLQEYKGAFLIASHDKYLLTKVTDKLLVFENNKITRLENGYEDYSNNNIKVQDFCQEEYEKLQVQLKSIEYELENSFVLNSKEYTKLNTKYYKVLSKIESFDNHEKHRLK